ncbi:Bifunctional protein GlmU [Usitatibacter rugosus]|uniref:Bifunctional protein GlmU n=2 Tax=Usitatibacter rugosus TaxID=2732067 RepID=A0A6M4H286_9PROT|nr:bifunctional UDP-N-acetylglucosamine diphosphorylase/glucosamine-1-phosphate N-acetyltransferase GlmU [Usitatibacter rugosus]QJR13198.1 Bifunctional protein GlmU [Usitatibacter rugosus]
MTLQVVILAAGQGKRMRSDLPKVLHPIGGKPLLHHVVATAKRLSPSRLAVVIGHGGESVAGAMNDTAITYATQSEQKGTGHAVMQALPALDAGGTVLILYGDVPLIASGTLRSLVDAADQGHLALLTQELAEPKGYGRIVRNGGRVVKIVEEKDATEAERTIREINTGIMAMPRAKLDAWLAGLRNDNAQAEYYLTDVVAAAVADGTPIDVRHPSSPQECVGVNSKAELAALERHYQMTQARQLLDAGVTLADPARLDVRGELTCGRDVSIDVNCIFEGRVVLGDGVKIGAHCIVRESEIGAGTQLLPFTMVDQAKIGANARIGPYARIRPDSTIGDEAHVGNFVEVKASTIGRGSKANHLAYVGDSTVGRDVNIGAGTITCNYDGANKHRTVIEDGVHIGSDVQLVAPVTVGKGATIGAGATITKDVPPGGLTVTQKTQVTRPEWKRPQKG